MDVTIIGTGDMARGIATRLLAGGNSVTFVGRDSGEAEKLAAELREGAKGGATASSGSVSGDVVILAVPYGAVGSVLQQHDAQLAGKIVVDITNPLNSSFDGLVTAPGISAAEENAKALPAGARLVKAFNTTFARTLNAGEVGGQPLDVLIAGDDADAKATVSRLAEAGGLRAIDAGPLHRARQLEALGLLHITLQQSLDTGFQSAVKFLGPRQG